MVDLALARARERALGNTKQTPAPPTAAPSIASGQTVKLQDGTVVPEEYYDLKPADQQRLVELIKQQETKRADDNAALLAVNQLLDLREEDNKRVRALESQLTTALGFIEVLQQQIAAMTTQIEVAKSDALLEQQAAIGQDIANLSAIRAEAGAEMAEFSRLRDEFATENRQALEAQATVVEALKESVKTTTDLMAERSNAIQDQLAEVEPQVQKLAVQQVELNDGINANRQTLRAVTGTDFASEIDLSVKRSFDARLEPAMAELVERKYVLLAPTTGTDGYDDRPEDGTDRAFLTQQLSDDFTARAVDQAFRRGGLR